jgi:hypothetical protein
MRRDTSPQAGYDFLNKKKEALMAQPKSREGTLTSTI